MTLPPASIFSRVFAPSTRRKIFVSYQHAGDQAYYDEFSRAFCGEYEPIAYDRSVDRIFGSSDPEQVMRSIREGHIAGSSCTIVLCGSETPSRKYVDWEIKATLDKEHGLIAVLLPTVRYALGRPILPDRLEDNVFSGYATTVSWQTLAAFPSLLTLEIEFARLRPKDGIRNGRPMRSINGPVSTLSPLLEALLGRFKP